MLCRMRIFGFIVVMAGVVLVELFVCVKLALVPVNLAKEPYRREERIAALTAYSRDGSPESEKLYREESRLASRHVLHRQLVAAGVLFAVLLPNDGMALLRWRHHEKMPATA